MDNGLPRDNRQNGLPGKHRLSGTRFEGLARRWRALGVWASRSNTARTAAKIGELVGKIAILFTIINYLVEAPDRAKQRHYQAWQILNSAHGLSGDGGRRAALLDLIADGVDLSYLDLSHANLSPDKASLDLYNPIMFSVVFSDVTLDHVRFLCGLPLLQRVTNSDPVPLDG